MQKVSGFRKEIRVFGAPPYGCMAVSVATERVRSLGSSGHSAFQGPLVTLTAAMALQRFPFDVACLIRTVCVGAEVFCRCCMLN